jgi:prepilin-type N-terminal cleavage/methylation domain-containing protein
MSIVRSKRLQSGFTLVELLIVAIILAILAAIIIPQFASTTVDAQESALRANSAAMRSAINLYRQQHNGVNAGVNVGSGGPACGGTIGVGGVGTLAALTEQLTRYSTMAGGTCSQADTGYIFGPYVVDDVLPSNPVTGDATITIVSDGDLDLAADTAGGGWMYDTATGKFFPNDTNLDGLGNAYATY